MDIITESVIESNESVINSIDMLQFEFTQPVAQSETFRVIFKYSDFEIDFLLND